MDVENGVTDKAEPTHRHFQSVGIITGENRFHCQCQWRLGEVATSERHDPSCQWLQAILLHLCKPAHFFMTSLSYMAMNKPVGEPSQISLNEKIVKGSIYVLNGAVVEEIAAPIALVFAFPPSKTHDVQNPFSNVEKWEVFKKQFVLDMISAKIATPALNHLVGLQDGRICCYWDNKKNVSMNTNQ